MNIEFSELRASWPDELILLETADTRALIAPGAGANCVGLRIGGRDLIESPRSYDDLISAPAKAGCPVLFPFPGKLPGGLFRFDGIKRCAPLNGPGGTFHQHGLVSRRAGYVLERNTTACVWSFDDSMLDEEERVAYPWPFRLTLRWSVAPGALRAEMRVDNTGDTDLPFGFGLHPYLLAGPDPAVSAPARELWPHDAGVPIGDPRPAEGPWYGGTLGPGTTIFLTGLPASVVAVDAGDVSISFPGTVFTELVLHRPLERPSICAEPWTSAPAAGAMLEVGRPHGLIRLPPGECWMGWTQIGLDRPAKAAG